MTSMAKTGIRLMSNRQDVINNISSKAVEATPMKAMDRNTLIRKAEIFPTCLIHFLEEAEKDPALEVQVVEEVVQIYTRNYRSLLRKLTRGRPKFLSSTIIT